tara:strand:- start:425 stop:646 length:222 start_codon:yes stop_codon:yes gene_type:complete
MKFNQQKAWLMDLDAKVGDIMLKHKPKTLEELWGKLPKKFKDNAIKWYVRERFNDIKGLPNEEDIYGIPKEDH